MSSFEAVHATLLKKAASKPKTDSKPKVQSFLVKAYAVFQENKLRKAGTSGLRIEATDNTMDLIASDEAQTNLNISRFVLRNQDKKTSINVTKLNKGAHAMNVLMRDKKLLVLILDAAVFGRLRSLFGKLFVDQRLDEKKLTAMANHPELKAFEFSSTSIHSPSVAPKPPTTFPKPQPTAAAAAAATRSPLEISHLEVCSDPSRTSNDCLVRVSSDALIFTTVPQTEVKFSTIVKIWFQPTGTQNKGTPMMINLKSGGQINFVLCKLHLSTRDQVRKQFVSLPNAHYLSDTVFEWNTGKFVQSIHVDKLEQLPMPAPKLPNDRPRFSKSTAPKPSAIGFAIQEQPRISPLESAMASTPKDEHRATKAAQRVINTYSGVKRAKLEEEVVSLITPIRRSSQFMGRSPSSAKDAKILFLYPSSNVNQDWGLDTITVRQVDRNTLCIGEYLNDSVIDFYAKYCFREYVLLHFPEMKQEVHVMSSFLFSRMDRKISRFRTKFSFVDDKSCDLRYEVYSAVRYWSRGVDLFKRKFLLVPINKSAHWSLAIVYLESREGDQPPQVTVYTLDSLGRYHTPSHIGNVLRLYLDHEWKARALALEQGKEWPLPARSLAALEEEEDEEGSVHSSDSDYCQIVDAPSRSGLEEDRFTVDHPVFASANPHATVSVRVPLQNDAVNCGIFALRNIKEFIDQYREGIKSENLFEDGGGGAGARLETVFNALRFSDANGFRRDLRSIMDKLAMAYNSGKV
ncbi:hypothetical protein BASA81_002032 [Batrachochytrium salamandrivorans]|nr:hypothetical protein BASA81_002032 [Batrachochytrium salamandrivorans]